MCYIISLSSTSVYKLYRKICTDTRCISDNFLSEIVSYQQAGNFSKWATRFNINKNKRGENYRGQRTEFFFFTDRTNFSIAYSDLQYILLCCHN